MLKSLPYIGIILWFSSNCIRLQCRLERAKSHTSQERKIRHIHRGVRKTVYVHSTTIPLSSVKFIWWWPVQIDRYWYMKVVWLRYEHEHSFPNSTMMRLIFRSCEVGLLALASRHCISICACSYAYLCVNTGTGHIWYSLFFYMNLISRKSSAMATNWVLSVATMNNFIHSLFLWRACFCQG